MKTIVRLLCIMSAASVAHADLGADLLAAYLFNGNAEDASGRGHHAQLIGATFTTDRHGNPGGAILLDGQGAYVATPVSGQRYPIAFSFWYRLDTRPGLRPMSLVDSGIGDDFGHSFVIGTGREQIRANLAFPGRFAPGQWQHVVVSYGGKLQVFIDGELAAEREYSEGPDYVAGNFHIGRHAGSDDQRFFEGAIDEVLIFSRALSAEDVRALYQGGETVSALLQQSELARHAESALAAAADARVAVESEAAEPRPILVVASGGAEPHTNAWAVFDDDAESFWAGAPGQAGWWIAAEYYPTLSVKTVDVEVDEPDTVTVRAFASETADEWTELAGEEPAQPVAARFLLITLTPNGEAAAPVVREIRPRGD